MRDIKARLEGKYKVLPDGCWLWTAAVGGSRSKRPQIRIDWKLYYAGRIMWELCKGPIPAGFLLCHTCDKELCINPEHMFLGSQTDNMRDASRKKRFKGKHRINEAVATIIKALRREGLTQSAISFETGIPIGTIGHILVGTRWS